MAKLDLERAKMLAASARTLLDSGDFTGVAGLAYQAFESATIGLLDVKNGHDQKSHLSRRDRIKQILGEHGEDIDKLWAIRNIDFYGNSSFGEQKRSITEEEARNCLEMVEELIEEIEALLDTKP